MSKTSWSLMCALHLPLLCFARSALTNSFFNDTQLYEGSPCQLRHGAGEGVCVKAVNCPRVLAQIQKGDHRHIGQCGFSNFDEIVCCTKSAYRIEDRIRPAHTACEEYMKMVQELVGSSFAPAVFNGVFAQFKEFPHMAALGYAASDDEEGAIRGMKYVCGGTLISLKHVITAAHCVSNVHGLVPVEVLLGTIDLTNPDSKTMQRIPISRVIKHPQYGGSLHYHDVAILELEKMIEISSSVHPTCLMTTPSSSITETGNPAWFIILGWGAIRLDGTTSTKLLKAEGLKFVEKNECSKKYINRRGLSNGLDDGMICVVDADTTRKADTCWGDSGGPLLASPLYRFSPLAGITSFGQACGGTIPGVYASVYKYLSWIEDQVWPAAN